MAKRKSTSTQRGLTLSGVIILIIAIGVALVQAYFAGNATTPTTPNDTPPTVASGNNSGGASTTKPGALPDMPVKPKPKYGTYKGCPPEGDGGDPAMNRLKNRTDDGIYVPVNFDEIFNLNWPATIERRDRDKWAKADAEAVAKYEGIPMVLEGYLVQGRESGEESPNCHGTANDEVDWHVWMTKKPGEERTKSIVIETTPRVRVKHQWTLKQVSAAARDELPVRISGWLFMDPEHPDQIGKTRGTIWEIHPIMVMEVKIDGQWVNFDDWTP